MTNEDRNAMDGIRVELKRLMDGVRSHEEKLSVLEEKLSMLSDEPFRKGRDENPITLSRLLAECSQKMHDLVQKAEGTFAEYCKAADTSDKYTSRFQESKFESLKTYLSAVLPAVDSLRRTASQWLEHGKLENTEQAEIRWRLAELEGMRSVAMNMIKGQKLPRNRV